MLDRAFAAFATERPGPAHIEIPLDVAKVAHSVPDTPPTVPSLPEADREKIAEVVDLLRSAEKPLILAGGGSRDAATELQHLAERLDAPVVLTTNARGMLHRHPLAVPASPSLDAVRHLIEDADIVLALGTEIGQTDYAFNATRTVPEIGSLIRVDICPCQLMRPEARLALHADAGTTIKALVEALPDGDRRLNGAKRAANVREQSFAEIGPEMRSLSRLLDTLRDTVPEAIMVGDSTQLIYAGNLYYDHDRPGGWFNAATGYGALGYAIPAAIGAALAASDETVLCLTGDGGAQFTLPELMVAVEEKLPVVFIVWNNRGYEEIATWMRAADVEVIGCDPAPPDFSAIAASCGMPFHRCGTEPERVAGALRKAMNEGGPAMIEIDATDFRTS